jgi:hypothetical protein
VVECTALEMRHRGNSIGGSNPSLSASFLQELGVKLTEPKPHQQERSFTNAGSTDGVTLCVSTRSFLRIRTGVVLWL